MKYGFTLVLLLTVSWELVQTKTFSCEDVFLFIDGCEISNVTVADDTIELSYAEKSEVTKLVILNSTLDDVPVISSEKSDKVVKLTYLECVGCGLKKITEKSFAATSLSTLTVLDISYGSYEKLQNGFFSQLTALRLLDLSHGAITEISDDTFGNLKQLRSLDLSHNKITKITSKMFESLDGLLTIRLSYNNIKVLDSGLFKKNDNLLFVFLDHNQINKIEGHLLDPEHILPYMTLSYNNLTTFDIQNVTSIFVDHNQITSVFITENVESLDASFNQISNVTCDKNGNKIDRLDMTNNSLTQMGCIDSLTELTDLHLDNNHLGKLNHSSFSALTNLRKLTLKSSIDKPLEFGVFSHQNKLEVLDISFNQLGNIAVSVLLAARGLEELYIDGNNITDLAYKDLTQTHSLGKIGLGSNSFNCTFLADVIKHFNSFNIDAVVSSGDKVTETHNLNGIGCTDEKDEKTSSPKQNDEKFDLIIKKMDNLTEALSKNVLDTKSELKNDEEIIQMSASLHFIKSVVIFLITLISAFCLFLAYRFLRNVSQLRRARTSDTLYTNMEM